MSEQEVKLVQHPTMRVIRQSTDYVVDGLGKVTVFKAIDAEKAVLAKEADTMYQGFAILGAMAGGQVRQFPVEFPIEGATSLDDAFDKFAEKAVAQLRANMEEARQRAEAERSKIVQAPAGAIPPVGGKLII